jgi:hypothetical protein
MENIVTLIVILIVLWSVISKRRAKKKARRGDAAPPGGSWIARLNTLLTDIQKRLQQQPKTSAGGTFDWRRLLDGEALRSQSDADEAAPDEPVFEEMAPSAAPESTPPADPAVARVTRADRTQPVPDTPRREAYQRGKPSFASTAASRSDLRKAVIWSEILGPPVALRAHERISSQF